jgi:hypothetical protein
VGVIESLAGVLLVALATSLGWGLRGEWGHWWGATAPGAFCGMATWLAFGGTGDGWQMLIFGAVMAISLSLGGVLSYGKIVGYVKSEHDRSPAFGTLALFLVGGLWGFFGGTGLGLLMTEIEYGLVDLATWALLASIGAYLAYKFLVLGLDLHLSPPRSDAWAAVLGGSMLTAAYFALGPGDLVVLRTAFLGWLGFGGGFSLGALVHRRCVNMGWKVDSWKFMEHSVGFGGGLALGVSAVLAGGNLEPIGASDAGLLASLIVVVWLMPYMNTSDNFEHWFRKMEWISGRTFAAFQAISLLCLVVLIFFGKILVETWSATGGYRLLFVLLLSLMVFLAISKFRFDRGRVRLLVDATFLGELAGCLALLFLL